MTCVLVVICLFLIYFPLSHQENTFPFPKYRERVKGLFQHAYDGYLKYAYPLDELRPLTCDGHDTWGKFSLTLVDALDTLVIMGNHTEFLRATSILVGHLDPNKDVNVSVFETNIRVVGGLLSAHLLSRRAGVPVGPGWPCSGPLLDLAKEFAVKLLPAFETNTGMPYGTVNLKYGVPVGETPVTCTAGVSTFLVEFGALTRLTGDPRFEAVAMRALESLWKHQSPMGLVGNHIDVQTGKWTALDSGIGAGVDSYFEYLVKGSILFQMPELHAMFKEYQKTIEAHIKHDDWHFWVHMDRGSVTLPIFQSLEAFWPGLQSLTGDLDNALKTLHNYHQVWKQFGFLPEFYSVSSASPYKQRASYPLRPELIESILYLYKALKDPSLLQMGVDILNSIENHAKTKCGFATIENVETHSLENRMESFFLAETTKYLYLLFDPDNFMHNEGDSYELRHVEGHLEACILEAGGYIFNTEAHPVDPAALYCCSAEHNSDTREAVKLFETFQHNKSIKESSWQTGLKNKTSFITNNHSSLLSCLSEPFHRPFSVFGQMFDRV